MKLTLMKHDELVLLLQKTADGIERHLPSSSFFGGKRRTSKSLTALLRGHARKRQQAALMYKAWLQMTRDLHNELRKQIIPTMLALRTFASACYGHTSEAYTDLGFQYRPRRRPSAMTLALATRKAAATRKARGTMGKKQRKKIDGVIQNGATP
jgi:hypothetical protein